MDILKRVYTDISSPGSFSSVENLLKEARKVDPSVTRKNVTEFLESERSYTIHKPTRSRYKRLKTIPSGFMTDVQVDLADFQKLASHNRGYRYMLVGRDVMSRRVFAVPVKSKSVNDMKLAFDTLLDQMPLIPWNIFSDKGKEFESRELKAYFNAKSIAKHMAQSDDVKACVAERVIRALKGRLYKYFSEKHTLTWVDILPKLLRAMNNSQCRTTGMRPNDMNEKNWYPVWQRLYGESVLPNPKKARYVVGDSVRIDKAKGAFAKGYLPGYTEEVFRVKKTFDTNPTSYAIEDLAEEPILGKFYNENFSKVR